MGHKYVEIFVMCNKVYQTVYWGETWPPDHHGIDWCGLHPIWKDIVVGGHTHWPMQANTI